MPAEYEMELTGIAPDLKFAVIDGGAAGNHTVTGIRLGEVLYLVLAFLRPAGPGDVSGISNLTSEFTISADGTINNTGGTATTDDQILVMWAAKSAYLPV